MIVNEIKENIISALGKMGVTDGEVVLERPANISFGDYSTSIALKLTKILKKNPVQIAEEIVEALPKNDRIEKVEIVKPGFINFSLSESYLFENIKPILQDEIIVEPFHLGKNRKIMIEFAHPNTHKLFHIGHLRNISIGESLVRILEAVGNKVIRSNYQGDVGLHIAKTMWYIKYKTSEQELNEIRKKSLHDRMLFLGKAYAAGQVAYDEDEEAKKKIIEINGSIYKQEGDIIPLWKETAKWSFDYFDQIYERVYTHFDRLYPESEFAQRALEICKIAEERGILERSEGALVFKGKKYGLDTRVFINSHGYPTYEGKEVALAEKEFSEFGELDECIHLVTPEQTSFFKVTFKVEELLDENKYKNKQQHLAYEWVKLKDGKMSSRTGNVIEAEWLIDKAKEKIIEKFSCSSDIAEKIAIAAVKYSFLKNSVFAQIAFDFEESISLEGNSGPYILYTYARTQSILKKDSFKVTSVIQVETEEEKILLRKLNQYSAIVHDSAQNFAPNIIANYLFDLAQSFNLFYQKHQILKADEDTKQLRLALTQATATVLKNGLDLLGIETVEKI